MRIWLPIRFDVWEDEVDYVDLSTSVRQGHYPPHFLTQGVFLLHPPLFFLIGGAWQALLRPAGNYFELVDSMRLLVALFAIITTGAIFLITRRLVGQRYGIAAGVLFAIDPYALRTNGRVFLETPGLTFVMVGYFLLIWLCQDCRELAASEAAGSKRWLSLRALLSGLVLGLGIVTLELTAIITIGPLLTIIWRRWFLARRLAVKVLLGAIAPYATLLISLALTDHLRAYEVQITTGLKRVFGLVHTTGFTAPDSPSLVHTLLSQVSSYGTTYLLAGIGGLAGIYLLIRGRDEVRLVGLIVVFGAASVAYEGLIGTIEEQFLYVMLVPAFVATACATATIVSSRRTPRQRVPPHLVGARHLKARQTKPRVAVRLFPALVGIAFIGLTSYDIGVWAVTRSSPDNGLQRVVTFFNKDIPAPGVVATNALVGVYVFEHSGISSVAITTHQLAAADHVRYIALLSAELVGGYGSIDAQQATWYEARGKVILSFSEATYGRVVVYETTNPAAW
jgi:4-amino-4-deoxy-L-arabinose transferase-like glycosyltransferase